METGLPPLSQDLDDRPTPPPPPPLIGRSGSFTEANRWNKIVMGKKILVPGLDVIMIAIFAEKYTVKDHISNT